jgi:hypothetical protein
MQANAKQRWQRQVLEGETCFVLLLDWDPRWWRSTQLALALDAPTLGMRFVVLAMKLTRAHFLSLRAGPR